jgi:hypothetical protein
MRAFATMVFKYFRAFRSRSFRGGREERQKE